MLIRPRFVAKRNAFNMVGSLFGLSQNGAILDTCPDNLFLDSARTTPITGPGDPVGGATDLSGNGNHFEQVSDADRMIYGRVPVSGRRNLLERTEEFDDAYWAKVGVTVAPNQSVAPDGTMAMDNVDRDTSSSRVERTVTVQPGKKVFSIYVRAGEVHNGSNSQLRVDGSEVVAHGFVATNEIQRISLALPGTDTATSVIVRVYPTTSSLSDPTSIDIWGAQLEYSSTPSAYQRVGSQFDVTEAGVRSIPYLSTNYTNQKLSNSLPAGTYTIVIAGTNGIWFDEITHAGGAFDLGPTTYPGGPEGILEVLGDILEVIPRQGAISATEKARIKAYYKSLGAPGEFEVEAESVVSPDGSSTTGWLPPDEGSLTTDGNELTVTNANPLEGVTSRRRVATDVGALVGETYLIDVVAKRGTADVIVGGLLGAATIGSGSDFIFDSTTYERRRVVKTVNASGGFLSLRSGTVNGGTWFIDSASVRKLTLNTGA